MLELQWRWSDEPSNWRHHSYYTDIQQAHKQQEFLENSQADPKGDGSVYMMTRLVENKDD